MCIKQISSCVLSSVKNPKRLFLTGLFLSTVTIFYLFLIANYYVTSPTVVKLLRRVPIGPLTLIYDPRSGQLIELPKDRNYRKEDGRKLILFWTPKYGDYSLKSWYLGPGSRTLAECDNKCDFSLDQELVQQANAVLFHPAVDMSISNTVPNPDTRSADQVYVMYWNESPHYTLLNLKNYKDFFNWTMTYRRDSDIYTPYDGFIKRQQPLDSVPDLYSREKTKLIAWLVSSCLSVSHREDLVSELNSSHNLQVHVYGACGSLECPSNTSINCMEWLGSQYKFYIAFENSLCRDYITEKFFNPLQHGMVPVFYGGEGLDSIAPPKSYISVRNFSSLSALADYLKYLDGNHKEYSSYFEWTKDYKIGLETSDYCRLCHKLNDKQLVHKSYESIHEWWIGNDNSHDDGRPICLEEPSYLDRVNAFIDYVL